MKLQRLLLCALLLLCGCAYYNTFYSARKAWDNAMEERRKNTLDVPGPNELGFYGNCIRSSLNLMSKYPKSKYVDEALLLIARCYLNKGDLDNALDRFHTLVDSLPRSALVPDALMGQGQTYAAMRKFPEAETSFAAVDARFPRFARADELLFSWGEMLRDENYGREALSVYTRLILEHPKSELRYQAQARRGDSYFQLEEFDSARAEFESVALDAPRPEQRLDAGLKIGEAYERLGQWDKAASQYRALVPEAQGLGREAEVQVRIAGAVLGGGDVDHAITMFERLKESEAQNKFSSVAAYQLGYIYENYKEDFDKARTYYEAVKTLPRSEFTGPADDRLSGLRQAQDFQKKLAEGKGRFDSRAEAAYQMGELEYFQMKRPARALDHFLSVERTYSYTRFGPKAAYSVGWVLNQQKHRAAADSAFARAAARYPQTTFGQAALDSLRAHQPDRADTLVALAAADTFNFPLPRPPEAVADSIAAAAFDDSVHKAAVADSLRFLAKRDTLEAIARAQAAIDSAEDVRTGRRAAPPQPPKVSGSHSGNGQLNIPAVSPGRDSTRASADSTAAGTQSPANGTPKGPPGSSTGPPPRSGSPPGSASGSPPDTSRAAPPQTPADSTKSAAPPDTSTSGTSPGAPPQRGGGEPPPPPVPPDSSRGVPGQR